MFKKVIFFLLFVIAILFAGIAIAAITSERGSPVSCTIDNKMTIDYQINNIQGINYDIVASKFLAQIPAPAIMFTFFTSKGINDVQREIIGNEFATTHRTVVASANYIIKKMIIPNPFIMSDGNTFAALPEVILRA
jgi:hypothetical protein